MQETDTITVRLVAEDLERLATEAARRGLTPDSLAAELLHEKLQADREDKLANARQALEQLRQFRESSPTLDGVALVREGRDELEHRGEA